jgi:hypothetical protein
VGADILSPDVTAGEILSHEAGPNPFIWDDYRTVQQGLGINNCWFISAVAGLAFRRPEAMKELIAINGDGSYKVVFPGRPPVDVLPNHTAAMHVIDGVPTPHGFANILEAAATAYGYYLNRGRAITMGLGVRMLTGRWPSLSSNLLFGFGSPWRKFHDKLERAEKDNKVVVIGTGISRIKLPGLQRMHCYSLLKYHPTERVAIMRDPQCTHAPVPEGRALPQYGVAAFWLTLRELQQNYMGMVIER